MRGQCKAGGGRVLVGAAKASKMGIKGAHMPGANPKVISEAGTKGVKLAGDPSRLRLDRRKRGGRVMKKKMMAMSGGDDEAAEGEEPDRPDGYAKGGWIKAAVGKHPGALHRALGVPQGEKIPASKLAKAAHSSNPTMRKRANLAKTLGKMGH